MKKYQFAHVSLVSCFRCHLNCAVTVSLPGVLIIIEGVLRIMYQQVGSLHKLKKARVAHFSPLYVGGKGKPPPGILNAIGYRSIQRVAVCQPGEDTHLSCFCIFTAINDSRPDITTIPDNLLLVGDSMKGAMRR